VTICFPKSPQRPEDISPPNREHPDTFVYKIPPRRNQAETSGQTADTGSF